MPGSAAPKLHLFSSKILNKNVLQNQRKPKAYFDYVKVRNWFKASDLDYCEVNEYTKEKKIAQARDMFYHNEKHFLLYTERCHFYRRFRLKGIRHLIFYQPPTFGWMFSELCNLLQKSFQNPRGGTETNMSITVIYSKYDIQR